jgi:hypothetical protein
MMSHVEECIPDRLRLQAEAARAWFSTHQGSEFKLTGIVNPEEADAGDGETASYEFQLILCGLREGQDVCLRERFRVSRLNGGFDVALLADETPDVGSPAPLLDPPGGVRARWLREVLPNHAFTVLLFYRGFW